MENKYQSIFGGRVALSGCCEGHIETTTNQKYFAYIVGLDTSREGHAGLLDHQGSL